MTNGQIPKKTHEFELSIKPQPVLVAESKPNCDDARSARVVVVTAC